MSEDHLLLTLKQTNDEIVPVLTRSGQLFTVFDKQDSGCISYGVQINATSKLFVKYSEQTDAIAYLHRSIAFYSEIEHRNIPKLRNYFHTPKGLALVFDWAHGEVLGSPDFPGEEGRSRPESPFYRFTHLSVDPIINALTAVYDVHAYLEAKGYVAVDFYDGCMIYDFDRHSIHICDFDYYSKGSFVLEMDRHYGSSRFMAPEEFIRGSTIDSLTNVYTMGAAAFVFLANNSRSLQDWRASEALFEVASKAVSADRSGRFDSVRSFYEAWRNALEAQVTK